MTGFFTKPVSVSSSCKVCLWNVYFIQIFAFVLCNNVFKKNCIHMYQILFSIDNALWRIMHFFVFFVRENCFDEHSVMGLTCKTVMLWSRKTWARIAGDLLTWSETMTRRAELAKAKKISTMHGSKVNGAAWNITSAEVIWNFFLKAIEK